MFKVAKDNSNTGSGGRSLVGSTVSQKGVFGQQGNLKNVRKKIADV